MRTSIFAAAVLASAVAAGSVCSETVRFTARLDGAQETPPKAVAGKGEASLTLNARARTLHWKVT